MSPWPIPIIIGALLMVAGTGLICVGRDLIKEGIEIYINRNSPSSPVIEFERRKGDRPSYDLYWTPAPLPDLHDFKVKKEPIAEGKVEKEDEG